MRKMFLLLFVSLGVLIANAQEAPTTDLKENKQKVKLDPNLVEKFEAALESIDKSFKVAIRSSDESDWMKEYMTKFIELKNIARELQKGIIKSELAADYNMPRYVIVMAEALIDCRKNFINGKYVDLSCLEDDGNSLSTLKSSGHSSTTSSSSRKSNNRDNRDNRKLAKADFALRSSYQDFTLAVAHLRENISSLKKEAKL